MVFYYIFCLRKKKSLANLWRDIILLNFIQSFSPNSRNMNVFRSQSFLLQIKKKKK